MNWTKLAEARIEEAIANGEFDNLPGRGQPLDLAEYFAPPAAERAGAALLKNANVVPPEVQLLKEIAELEEAIAKVEGVGRSDGRYGSNGKNGNHESHTSHFSYSSHRDPLLNLREQLQEKRVAFALAMERRRRREPHPME